MMYIPKSIAGKTSLLAVALILLQSCASSKKNNSQVSGNTYEQPSSAMQKKYAALIGVSPGSIVNNALYSYIDKWLNTAYQYGSQTEKGVDCSGFTQMLYDAVYKKKLPRTSEAQYDASATFNNTRNLVEGDLVFFTTIKGKKISHVGIYLQNNRFVNATSKGIAISDMSIPYWKEKFVAGGRM
ncbi:MAG: C40 family peptidase [Chitinophagaceae bacterium]